MKRLFIFLLLIFIISIPVNAVHVYPDYTPPGHKDPWDGYMGYQPSADLAKIIHDYGVITEDPRDMFVALFNIEKSEIISVKEPLSTDNIVFFEYLCVRKTAQEIVEFVEGIEEYREVVIYYYNFDGSDRIEKADVKMYTSPWINHYGDYSCLMQLYISNEGLKHLDKKLSELLDTINTPEMLFDVCGAEIPEEYHNPELYHNPVTAGSWGYVYGDYFWILAGDVDTGAYNHLTKRMRIGFIGDTPANDSVYLTDPWCAKILRAFNRVFYRRGVDPIYGYKFKEDDGCERIEMTVNYAKPEGVEEGDYLSYTVDNIAIEINIIDRDVNKNAPQTGTPIVPLAITAAAAFTVTGVILKKKRSKA